jgi:WD40 repeat protein
VTGCAISPTGDFIVSASVDHTLKVWDTRTGVERLTLIGHSSAVSGCAVSPTGNFIISASADQTLKVWDAHTGVCLDTFLAEGFLAECAFCPDGGHIVAVGEQGVYFLRLLV